MDLAYYYELWRGMMLSLTRLLQTPSPGGRNFM